MMAQQTQPLAPFQPIMDDDKENQACTQTDESSKRKRNHQTAAEKRQEQRLRKQSKLCRSISSPPLGLGTALARAPRPVLGEVGPQRINRASSESSGCDESVQERLRNEPDVFNLSLDVPISPGKDGLLDDEEEEDEAAVWSERPCLPSDDLSLKHTVCFRSSKPFDWCRAIPSALEARALMARHAGMASGGSSEGAFRSDSEALACWSSSCLYFAHPAEPLFMELVPALQKYRERAPLFLREPAEDHVEDRANFTRRIRQWEEAFVSVFQAYCHGLCPGFYYQAQDFTVHFTRDESVSHDDPSKPDPGLMAVFSASTRWLRVRLREAGVPFTAPLVGEADLRADLPQDETPDVAEELKHMMSQHALVETAKPRKPRHDRAPLPPTRYCLVVRGNMAVRGLSSFLQCFENASAPKQSADVPRLLCTHPFLHASLKKLQVVFNSQVQRSQSPASPFGGSKQQHRMEAVYQLMVRGAAILPCALRQLCRVVHYMHGNGRDDDEEGVAEAKEEEEGAAAAGQRDWAALMELVPGTEAFNLPPEALQQAAVQGTGGSEQQQGRGPVPGAVRAMRVRSVEEVHWLGEEKVCEVKRVGRHRWDMQGGRREADGRA